MKLKELKKIINGIDNKYSEAEILVDTEAARFNVHMVEITSVTLVENKVAKLVNMKPFIDIQLSDEVKTH